MHLVALMIALGAERWIAQWLHLRELRWLDVVYDRVIVFIKTRSPVWQWAGLLLVPVVLTLPIWLLSLGLVGVFKSILYVIFSAVVLFFSLGPRDLLAECDGFIEAVENDDFDQAEISANAILEYTTRLNDVKSNQLASAVFTQSKNRIFAVLFWFVVFGPAGAWFIRVTDLFRRRLAFEVKRNEDDEALFELADIMNMIHGVLAWIPARLLALSFALMGSFDGAWQNVRDFYATCSARFFEINAAIVAHSGLGALGASPEQHLGQAVEGHLPRLAHTVVRARALVWRTLFFLWIVFLALMTVSGVVR